MHASCCTHLIFLDLITCMIFGEEYKLWSVSSCSFLLHPVTYPLVVQIFSPEPWFPSQSAVLNGILSCSVRTFIHFRVSENWLFICNHSEWLTVIIVTNVQTSHGYIMSGRYIKLKVFIIIAIRTHKHTHICIYIHTRTHIIYTYIRTYVTYINTYIHTYVHYIHTYITYIHIYIRTYIHTYVR
jgi:hypothetical protein